MAGYIFKVSKLYSDLHSWSTYTERKRVFTRHVQKRRV